MSVSNATVGILSLFIQILYLSMGEASFSCLLSTVLQAKSTKSSNHSLNALHDSTQLCVQMMQKNIFFTVKNFSLQEVTITF
jgi:hypothetical protein